MHKVSVYKLFVLLVICTVDVNYASPDDCPSSSSSTTYARLRNALLCDYDPYTRPVLNHQNSTAVYFRFILKYFTYDVTLSTLSLDAWMKVNWQDEHLKWNPEDYDNIKVMYFSTLHIWTPDLSVYNRAEQGGDPSTVTNTRCTVNNKGNVLCVPSLHIDSLCVPDLSLYPYDSQNCALRVGSWVHKGEEIDMKLLDNIIVKSAMEPNGEWEIDSYTAKKFSGHYKCCPNVTYPSIEINFKIQRLHGAHAASVIIPTAVVVILTFTALASSPLNTERLVLCYVNVLVQFIHVQYLSWQIPLKGDKIPLLILYARDSLLMAALAIVFTIIFKKMMQWKTFAPPWISSFVIYITGNFIGQFLFLRDDSVKSVAVVKGEEDGTNIIQCEQKNSLDWEIFAKILDFLLLTCYAITYLIMTIEFIVYL